MVKYGGLGTASSVAEKANSRVTIPSTWKTNPICALVLQLSGLPLCLSLLDKGFFKMGEVVMHHLPPG